MGGFKKYSINEHMRESTIQNFIEEISDMIIRIESFKDLNTTNIKTWYQNGSLHNSPEDQELEQYQIQENLTQTIHSLHEAKNKLETM